jgi:hypothetical protein
MARGDNRICGGKEVQDALSENRPVQDIWQNLTPAQFLWLWRMINLANVILDPAADDCITWQFSASGMYPGENSDQFPSNLEDLGSWQLQVLCLTPSS